ncbi:hypothetical protein FOA52_007580 [Chlamydomonas sp. UWO 241]|nr:hypothetical protein FOA52_007580 [Chlamydomonas sp. UWO 241]
MLDTAPLAIVHSGPDDAQDSYPSGSSLVTQLQEAQASGRLDDAQRAWLSLLARTGCGGGSQGEGRSVADEEPSSSGASGGRGVEHADHACRLAQARLLIGGEPGGVRDAAAQSMLGAGGLDVRGLSRVASANAYGCSSQDPGLVAAGRAPALPGGLVAIYPLFSLLNHSCSPNAACVVEGGAMAVRAGCGIAAGEQLTVSYLGPRLMAPVDARRAHLERTYGFVCGCDRCAFEAGLPPSLADFVAQAALTGEQLAAASGEAHAKKDANTASYVDRMLVETRAELHARAARVRLGNGWASPGIVDEPGVSLLQLSWLECSLWTLTRLQLDACGGDLDPEQVASAREAVEVTAPGSDLHASLAARELLAAASLARVARGRRERASAQGALRAAAEAVGDAYGARYGDACTAGEGMAAALCGNLLARGVGAAAADWCVEQATRALAVEEGA